MKAQNLIHSMGEAIINAIKIPFSHYTVINEDRILDLIEELEASLPEELERAEALVGQRDQILAEARQKADDILAQARVQAQAMISQEEITKAAVGEAERVRQDFEIEQQRQQAGAERYADEVLAELESKLSRAMATVQNGRQSLNVN